jgi:hypothetical protein
MALNQKKFHVRSIASAGDDVSELEEEYDRLSAQVDKMTLKLFILFVEAGKLERAFDLVERLHLEKSFDIAITIAERLRQGILCDKIEERKYLRFGGVNDDDHDHDDDVAIDTRVKKGQEKQRDESLMPPLRSIRTPEESTELGKRPRPTPEDNTHSIKPTAIQRNPFAKSRMESPPRFLRMAGEASSPNRFGKLSRLSTFSSKSRELRNVRKILL